MKNTTTLRTSVHSDSQVWLRSQLAERRKQLGLSQKGLAEKMGVIASFIGKVETGDRRLDVLEFISYCRGLEINPVELFALLIENYLEKGKGEK